MPTRTYTGIDFINYVELFNSNLDALAVATPQNKFDVGINASENHSFSAPGNYVSECNYAYEMIGDLDFDVFPSIPDNALIQSVEVKVDIELNATVEAEITAGVGVSTCTLNASLRTFRGLDELTELLISEIFATPTNSTTPKSIVRNEFDHFTKTALFDFTGAPITKAQLIADYSTWRVVLSAEAYAQQEAAGVCAGHSSIDVNTNIDGIRITVTYTEGGIVRYTASPAGGDVGSGQIIVVTGEDVAELDFFFETEDGIIPVIPKIISEDEVWIEVPWPATDPCYDCFPSCPQCDAAFIPCDADFESAECQAAIEACLDCLSACLLRLELAEECQNSSHYPPDVIVPVILIAGTQFSGNVPLGNFNIIIANGSGLYRFTLGQTHDKIYTAARDGTTYDVKIPDPGGKTGFFRS